jgi:hypothetical protein
MQGSHEFVGPVARPEIDGETHYAASQRNLASIAFCAR